MTFAVGVGGKAMIRRGVGSGLERCSGWRGEDRCLKKVSWDGRGGRSWKVYYELVPPSWVVVLLCLDICVSHNYYLAYTINHTLQLIPNNYLTLYQLYLRHPYKPHNGSGRILLPSTPRRHVRQSIHHHPHPNPQATDARGAQPNQAPAHAE